MADEKQVCESGGKKLENVKIPMIPMPMEVEADNSNKDSLNHKLFGRETSFPGDVSDSNSDSVFSPTVSASLFHRKSSFSSEININDGAITPSHINKMRPKSTSSCRSSSVSDDDRSIQLSPHLRGKRPRTYSDSLNVDCTNHHSPSPSPVSIPLSCII